jgi:hypothetical protein
VVAALEMAEETFDALSKGDGRLCVDMDVFSLACSEEEVTFEEGAIGCAIGTEPWKARHTVLAAHVIEMGDPI